MKAHTYKLLYIVFLLAVMVGTMQAQSYIIEKADMNQGLESNDILCTAQDCNGVIYVGTGGGLYRFNGSRHFLLKVREGGKKVLLDTRSSEY